MASRLKLSVAEVLKDPIPHPAPHVWSDDDAFDEQDPSWWVGSRAPCAYLIPHSTVSRAQFLIRPDGLGQFVLRNLGTYGTHVDGVHLLGNDEAILRKTSAIRVGAVYLSAETQLVAPPRRIAPEHASSSADDPWSSSVTGPDGAAVDIWGAWGVEDEDQRVGPKPADPTRRPKQPQVTDPGLAKVVSPSPGSNDETMDRILAAAGIPLKHRSRAAGVVQPEDIGQLLAAWVKGARSAQFVKREIKEAHRLQPTATLDGSVNPLRKAIPAEEILSLLLGFEGPLYARGADAVKQWFADLIHHETALPDAVKEAWVQFMSQLAPERIAERANEAGLFEKVSKAHRMAALWQAYEEYFRHELSDPHLSFRRLFVPGFSKAYSDAMSHDGKSGKKKRQD